MTTANKRNLQLDFLRGVAILLVLGRHLELPRPDGSIGTLAHLWFTIGWLGVDLFFVLSGFLIGGLLLAELKKYGQINIPRFLARRGLKIYPPYLVFLAYVALMPSFKTFLAGEDAWELLAKDCSMLWPNLLFLQNYVGSNPIGHTWTLAVEEHFYLLLPFVLALLASTGRVRLLVPICLAMVPVFLTLRCLSVWNADAFSVTVSATHLRLDALLFGVGIRAMAEYLPERFQGARRWRGLMVMTGIILWLPNVFIEPSTPFIRTFGLTASFLGSAAFLVAAYQTHEEDFGRWKQFAIPIISLVAWIGVYSYAIYLWHVTTIGILEREAAGRLAMWIEQSTPLWWLLSAALVCGGAILSGVVAAKVVEWPVLRFRDRFFPTRSAALPVVRTKSENIVCSEELVKGPSLQPLGSLKVES